MKSYSLMTFFLAAGCASVDGPDRTLSSSSVHLRSGAEPEWEEFAGTTPDGNRLEIKFPAHANQVENTLCVRQDNVKLAWPVLLNGTKIGELHKQQHPLVMTYTLPRGALKDGENVLSITPPAENDDVIVGPVWLELRPPGDALGQATLRVLVIDSLTNAPLPCRITVVSHDGALAPIVAAPDQGVAVRPGVLYTAGGPTRFMLPAGSYIVYATRGFEYGVDEQEVSLKPGDGKQIVLAIRREVLTPNLASCDPHVHTLTFSGHGDCTLDERMITLAGEGIEIPISTEHNQHRSYQDAAIKTGVRDYFTPIDGNEVTTNVGHFNVFPVAGPPVANATLTDWTEILRSIHATPGVKVAILNHPRSLHTGFRPFDEANLNPVTGENRLDLDSRVDAIELVNSGALRSDLLEVYRDWFALLNHGYRIAGVGASDSHDVNFSIVGQGRTYVACNDADPSRIDANEVCDSFLKGKLLVSMGLLAQISVNERYGPGDLVTGILDEIRVAITVSGPSWCTVDHVELYANGVNIREVTLPVSRTPGEKVKLDWRLSKPAQDCHLVAIATGPGVKELYWPTARPYQPNTPVWTPRVIGSTNPVWIDADGDGNYTPPRTLAKQLIAKHGAEAAQIIPALAPHDEAVSAQAASLCLAAGQDLRSPVFTSMLRQAPAPVQRGFAAYLATIGEVRR